MNVLILQDMNKVYKKLAKKHYPTPDFTGYKKSEKIIEMFVIKAERKAFIKGLKTSPITIKTNEDEVTK